MSFKHFILILFCIIFYNSLSAQDAWESYNQAFQDYFAQQKFDLALKMAEKEYEHATTNDVPIYQLAFSCSDMGLALYALNRYREAEEYLLMSVEHNMTMSGKESDNTLAEINQLSMIYAALEENHKADSLLRIIIDVNEKKHGKEHEKTIDAVKALIKFHDILTNTVEVAQLRALYNIPEPDCNCPADQAKKDSLLTLSLDSLDRADSLNNIQKIPVKAGAIIDQEQSKEKPIIHTVKKGDTLYAISIKYKVSIDDLKKWNELKSNMLFSGQKLSIKK